LSGAALWGTTVPGPGGPKFARSSRLSSYPVASFSDLAEAWPDRQAPGPLVFDVRHGHEWRAGHLSGARHLPLPELAGHRAEVPTTVPVWVHCGAGFRAAAAASLLSGWGASPVFIDDTWANAEETDLPIVKQVH
ncbi:MAG: rhodanese-like domain-containing protein, partial [Acidimicrobiales bacterium]